LRLIAATRNRAKVEEIARLVAGMAQVEPLPIEADDAPEEGDSFEDIAVAKAVFWSRRIDRGELVVATDGGLVIPALGDRWDPRRTRRFAGPVSDVQRARALLSLAKDLTGDQRCIVWREALAVARDGTVLASWTEMGEPGVLAPDVDPAAVAAGNGFWIPTLWLCPECGGRRLADLTPRELAARPDHWQHLGADLRAFLGDLDE
jgi:inosine/xanthosine triphosphate pyrophosphatase family protein